jgi:hypothetical protein
MTPDPTTNEPPVPVNPGGGLPLVTLIAQTTAEDLSHAVLSLTAGDARRLLAYRPVWEAVRGHDVDLYCLEFFDYRVTYLDSFRDDFPGDPDTDADTWYLARPGTRAAADAAQERDEAIGVAAPTLKVTRDGVLWDASHKHTGGSWETPELSWEQLEALARGETPFELVPDQIEPDDEEDDDDDAGTGDDSVGGDGNGDDEVPDGFHRIDPPAEDAG